MHKQSRSRRIAALFAPYWKQEALALACIVATSLLGLVPPYIVARIIDNAIPSGSLRELGMDVLFILDAALVSILFGVLQTYLSSTIGEGIMRDLRTRLVAHLHRVPIRFFVATKTGEIMNRLSGDVDKIDSVVTGTLTGILTNVVTILTTIAWMFVWNWRLALLSMAVLPLMVLPLPAVTKRMYGFQRAARKKRDEIEAMIQETLSVSGITLVKLFGRERYENERFHRAGTDLMNVEIQVAMAARWLMSCIKAMVIAGPAIVWFGGGWFAIRYGLDVGLIVAFVQYIQGRLYGPATQLAEIHVQIVNAVAVFDRVFEYLDIPIEQYTPAAPSYAVRFRGDIAFENVSFSYGGSESSLENVSFRIQAGQVAAFVGASGAGKSTIAQLLPRFYDPSGGRVLIDGQDVRTMDLRTLRREVGIVTQDTYLFHAPVLDNLLYSRPDAGEEDVYEAARAGNIHDFILTLPHGYRTVVGERGYKLSGGERQRLSIARVILKNPGILVLDEATSSLDSHNEAAIHRALLPIFRGRTTLIIAHRLSTVLEADVIFVVRDGRIVESGAHEALLARNGEYARMYRRQFAGILEKQSAG